MFLYNLSFAPTHGICDSFSVCLSLHACIQKDFIKRQPLLPNSYGKIIEDLGIVSDVTNAWQHFYSIQCSNFASNCIILDATYVSVQSCSFSLKLVTEIKWNGVVTLYHQTWHCRLCRLKIVVTGKNGNVVISHQNLWRNCLRQIVKIYCDKMIPHFHPHVWIWIKEDK